MRSRLTKTGKDGEKDGERESADNKVNPCMTYCYCACSIACMFFHAWRWSRHKGGRE